MADVPSAPEVARLIADVLEAAGVRHAIGGAIALGLHAPPRATNDVDVTVFVPPERLDPVLDALAAAGAVVDRADAVRRARDRGKFEVRVQGMRVDVFVPSIPFYASVEQRVREGVLLGRRVAILSAEDLTVFKLLFFRGKDLVDLERLVAFQGMALDARYVRGWLVDMCGEDDARVARWDAIVATHRGA